MNPSVKWQTMGELEAKDLSIIIPAWNEEKTIITVLQKIEEAVILSSDKSTPLNYEIIVVDDGSLDNTYKLVINATEKNKRVRIIRNEENEGKGSAIKTGFNSCRGKVVTFIDADLDLSPSHIPKFIELMTTQHPDIIIGSKRHPFSIVQYPFSRRLLSQIYHLVITLFFHLNLSDTQVGLKMFRYELLEDILPSICCKKYAFDLEVLVSTHHRGYKIVEAPIELKWQRDHNRISLGDVWGIMLDTLAIFYRWKLLKQYDYPHYQVKKTVTPEVHIDHCK
jgi:glycosyltransferase involved in cell wall biosynthesis